MVQLDSMALEFFSCDPGSLRCWHRQLAATCFSHIYLEAIKKLLFDTNNLMRVEDKIVKSIFDIFYIRGIF